MINKRMLFLLFIRHMRFIQNHIIFLALCNLLAFLKKQKNTNQHWQLMQSSGQIKIYNCLQLLTIMGIQKRKIKNTKKPNNFYTLEGQILSPLQFDNKIKLFRNSNICFLVTWNFILFLPLWVPISSLLLTFV